MVRAQRWSWGPPSPSSQKPPRVKGMHPPGSLEDRFRGPRGPSPAAGHMAGLPFAAVMRPQPQGPRPEPAGTSVSFRQGLHHRLWEQPTKAQPLSQGCTCSCALGSSCLAPFEGVGVPRETQSPAQDEPTGAASCNLPPGAAHPAASHFGHSAHPSSFLPTGHLAGRCAQVGEMGWPRETSGVAGDPRTRS